MVRDTWGVGRGAWRVARGGASSDDHGFTARHGVHVAPAVDQVSNPGFSLPYLVEMSKDATGSSVTLRVVRPLDHPTHPISASDATTSFVFATGSSTALYPLGQHGSNKGVRLLRTSLSGVCAHLHAAVMMWGVRCP
jgi:hypothetical protein